MPAATLTIHHRFCGPPRSGNGGWTSGALAAQLTGAEPGVPVEVGLRRPPPLDRPLALRTGPDDLLGLYDESTLLAEARRATSDPGPTAAVTLDEATAAADGYPGHRFHPFPTCYSCGTARPDGLRVFPGPLAGDPDERVAAPWTPQTPPEEPPDALWASTWAALDCVGGWAGDLAERLMVLARMVAVIDALPDPGVPHVVVGRPRGQEGRKVHTASALWTADGRPLGRAEHLWIQVDPRAFQEHA